MAGADAVAHHAALDARLARAAKPIRLLSLASWPASEQQAFLAGWARGNPHLPRYQYPRLDFSDARRELSAIAAAHLLLSQNQLFSSLLPPHALVPSVRNPPNMLYSPEL